MNFFVVTIITAVSLSICLKIDEKREQIKQKKERLNTMLRSMILVYCFIKIFLNSFRENDNSKIGLFANQMSYI